MMLIDTLLDVSSAKRHSRYFNQTRSDFLFKRLRVIAILLALLQPAWIVVDYLLISTELLGSFFILRAAAALACLFLGVWAFKRYNLTVSYFRLFALVFILLAFHIAATSSLITNGYSAGLAGYDFFPFMIISMMAVFPLSLVETAIYILGVLAVEAVTLAFRGELATMQGMNSLWLLAVLGVIAGWAAVNQMNMLLGLYRQATRDPLTGLSNRRQALEQLTTDIEHCRESSQPLSLMLFDLDKFKSLNDNFGHATGDMVLKNFSQLMHKLTKRRTDICCRYGGEEFLIVLPGRDIRAAAELAESIRLACHGELVKTPTGDKVGYTTSIGVAQLEMSDDLESLIKAADDALYAAKSSGRDQYQLARQ